MKSERALHVAIVGAGFSGTMLAVHLHRLGSSVTLIDRSGTFAQGLAYSTQDRAHLLNVRAASMSAFADRPDHFANWLAAREEGDGMTFAKRASYREYLEEIFGEIRAEVNSVADEAVSLAGTTVELASGRRLAADAIVIAAGNLPPAPFGAMAAAGVVYVADPWTSEGRAGLAALARQGEDVLILGTGLTMVDTVLALDEHGFDGRIVALSRRGQMPEPHAEIEPGDVMPPVETSPGALMRWARRQSIGRDWRAVVDSLRPRTAAIWRSWSPEQRGRFVRHVRPWWDVRRHRIAPEVWDRLQSMMAQGRLEIRAGKIVTAGDGRVDFRLRGRRSRATLAVAGVINCTGPQGDIRRSRDRLIHDLLERGAARADSLGLGLDVDTSGRLLGAGTAPEAGLYAIGPITRGSFWESVAVPDIRAHAQALAETIVADAASALPAPAWQAA